MAFTTRKHGAGLLERQAATRMAVVFRVYAASGRFMTRLPGDLAGLPAKRNDHLRIRAVQRHCHTPASGCRHLGASR